MYPLLTHEYPPLPSSVSHRAAHLPQLMNVHWHITVTEVHSSPYSSFLYVPSVWTNIPTIIVSYRVVSLPPNPLSLSVHPFPSPNLWQWLIFLLLLHSLTFSRMSYSCSMVCNFSDWLLSVTDTPLPCLFHGLLTSFLFSLNNTPLSEYPTV